jgi:asparagine synthase (glutamine-hydrolysing)
MSMAHSLEVRPPFLDHRIVEFAGTLPPSLKVNGSTTKFVMREMLKSKLPAAILSRRKEGLDIPAHDWLRGPLRPLLEQELSTESVEKAGIFSASAIQNLVQRHLRREANLGYHLWGLLTLHLWVKRWKISTKPVADPVGERADVYSAAL